MLIEAQPHTNILLQTITNKHSGTNLQTHSPEFMICHKNAPTNINLQYYCSMHTLSPNLQIKPHIFPHTYRSKYTISRTHTEQGTQSPTHTYRAEHTNFTHIQSKAYNIPHTYRARHRSFHTHTGQSIRSSTGILPHICCHKHVSQDIPLPRDVCYQIYSSRHTFNYGHFPADIISPNTILVHMYRSLGRHGYPRTQQHRYHSKATCHGRQDYQRHNC